MAIQKFADGSSLDTATNIVTDAQGVPHPPTPNLPTAPLNLAGITGGSTPPVASGTDSLRGNLSSLDALGQETQKLLEEKASPTDLSASLTTLENQRKAINSYSQQELSAIDEAGRAAGLEYDPLITEAEKAKRFGMPKAIVGAGERGGFMNTQFSGAAALVPTEGGSWVGAGGELERIKSVYDDNISKLQANKQQAIAQAKIAARQAIRTGKVDDFNIAKSLYEVARQSHQDSIDLQAKKLNALNNYNQEKRADITAGYNAIKDQMDIIENLPEGKTVEIKNPITGEMMTFEGSKLAKPFFSASELTQIMLKLDKGETASFKDPNTGETITLTGLISQTPKTSILVDDKGYAHTIDTLTGKEIARSTIPVGKSKTQAAQNITIQTRQEMGGLVGEIYDSLKAKIGTDAKTNTKEYLAQKEKFVRTGLGSAKDFYDRFSPLEWLNPDYDVNKPIFKDAGIKIGGGGSIQLNNSAGSMIINEPEE